MWYKFVKLEQGYLETTPYLLMSPVVSFCCIFWGKKVNSLTCNQLLAQLRTASMTSAKGVQWHYILHTLYMISIIIGNVYMYNNVEHLTLYIAHVVHDKYYHR